MGLEFFSKIFSKKLTYQILMKIRSTRTNGRTDRYDEASINFSQFFAKALIK